jgi:hypothetical protein
LYCLLASSGRPESRLQHAKDPNNIYNMPNNLISPIRSNHPTEARMICKLENSSMPQYEQ